MKRRFFSIFGIVAIVAFFLPWLKACDQVESGYGLLIAGSLKDFSGGSLSSINTGFVLLLVPAYFIGAAWLGHIERAVRPLKSAFGIISVLSLWNTGVWGGVVISALIEEWGTDKHLHSITMAKMAAISLIGAVLLMVFLLKWLKTKRFNFGWSCAVLIFPLFGVLGFGFTWEPHYYGMWLYLISLGGLFTGAVWDGVTTKT